MQTEKVIQNSILLFLRTHPKVSYAIFTRTGVTKASKFRNTRGSCPNGCPDIIGSLKGNPARSFVIECKKPGGKTSKAQIDFLEKVEKDGGLALLAFSLEDVKSWIENLSRKENDSSSNTSK
jgi:hypothetical protein